jgi:hypothetical protein
MMALAQRCPAFESEVLWSDAWGSIAGSLERIGAEVASASGVSKRDLIKEALLQLPQYSRDALSSESFLRSEMAGLAFRTNELQRGFESWIEQRKICCLKRGDFRAALVPESVAYDLHLRFHYLHSPHAGETVGIYHGSKGPPAAIATISPMDVEVLRKYVPAGGSDKALLLSRVFAFDWAPPNSISYLLSQVSRWVKMNRPRAELLLTFVNPNLGFSGSSYQASNWQLVGNHAVVYRYVDGRYVSAREHCALAKAKRQPLRLAFSKYEMSPLDIWAFRIRGNEV